MLSSVFVKKNKKYLIYYNLKHKLNCKYKKIIKYNKYNKIYNPRQEIYNSNKILVKKNKFYIK